MSHPRGGALGATLHRHALGVSAAVIVAVALVVDWSRKPVAVVAPGAPVARAVPDTEAAAPASHATTSRISATPAASRASARESTSRKLSPSFDVEERRADTVSRSSLETTVSRDTSEAPALDFHLPHRSPVLNLEDPRVRVSRASRCDDRSYRARSRRSAGAVFAAANLSLYEYFRRAWWSAERRDFFVRSDWDTNVRNQDKLGHAWGGYFLTRGGAELLESACVEPKRAALIAAAYATAFQLQVEVWDGFQEQYGFSAPDVVANGVGAGLALATAYVPALEHVRPAFSYAPTPALRRHVSASVAEPTADYAGQTYWLAVDVESLLPPSTRRYWPGLLRVSLGHSVTDFVDPFTGAPRRGQREIVLSLDLDARRLPGNHPKWRAVKDVLSYYHFPSPAIVLAPDVSITAWYR